MGRVEQELTFCTPSFVILSPCGDTLLRVSREAWCHPCRTGEGEPWTVFYPDGDTEAGSLTTLMAEDQFSLCFPQDLQPATKATLLGCFFLLDFLFY